MCDEDIRGERSNLVVKLVIIALSLRFRQELSLDSPLKEVGTMTIMRVRGITGKRKQVRRVLGNVQYGSLAFWKEALAPFVGGSLEIDLDADGTLQLVLSTDGGINAIKDYPTDALRSLSNQCVVGFSHLLVIYGNGEVKHVFSFARAA